MRLLLIFVTCFKFSLCSLWPKGVVHFAINKKDYDIHSQDVIMSTFAKIQSEICVKFFNTPTNYTATHQDKILYISNPDKRKDCPPDHYDFSGSVVDMPIGYRCINEKDISRIAVDMLRASIAQTVTSFNSYDLIQKFKERDEEASKSSLLPSVDRNFINAHYHTACGDLNKPVGGVVVRRAGDEDVTKMSGDNEEFYESRRWPLGIVMYGVDPTIPPQDEDLNTLNHAMTTIELATCIVFQRITETEVLEPNNYLWFTTEGEELPHLGFYEGKQTLKLSAMTRSAPGHTAHALTMLLRVIGVPMMSNRFDRDNYVTIDWKNVEYGKEHYLEKVPKEAWLKHLPYDFSSATHAPANYACRDCKSPTSAHTVIPVQDLLWQKTLSMGHRIDLSESDIQTVNFIYEQECDRRAMAYKFT